VSEEIVFPSDWDKNRAWAHLITLHPFPHLSQFKVIQENLDITALGNWPMGNISPYLLGFPVPFEAELPTGGTTTLVQDKMTPQHSVQEGWQILHHDHPDALAVQNIDTEFDHFIRKFQPRIRHRFRPGAEGKCGRKPRPNMKQEFKGRPRGSFCPSRVPAFLLFNRIKGREEVCYRGVVTTTAGELLNIHTP
jgi:hypothetical protein